MEPPKKMLVVSSDRENFEVDEGVIKCSRLLKAQLTNRRRDGCQCIVFPVCVEAPVLERIIEWAEKHKKDPEVFLRTEKMCPWDAEWLDEMCIELQMCMLNGARVLDIRALTAVISLTIAAAIKGKSTEELQKLFNIECDLTKEDVERILEENDNYARTERFESSVGDSID